jgi:hypothetical protein
VVQGRAADLIKVGGKRSSLEALTAELRIPGVLTACSGCPSRAPSAGRWRVSAFRWPGMDKPAILAQLRDRIDPAFLPRP